MKYTHCSNCDFPMEAEEVYFHESGSLLTEPIDLCEECFINIHGVEPEKSYDNSDDWLTIFDELDYWS